jgi:hypothetical protein
MTQKILNKLLDLLDKWDDYHTITCSLWNQITNLSLQSSASYEYLIENTNLPNRYTTPKLFLKHPDLLEKLISKQIQSREDCFTKLRLEFSKTDRLLKSMNALLKDVTSKASKAQEPRYFNPVDISLHEISEFTQTLLNNHQSLVLEQQKLLDFVDAAVENYKHQWVSQNCIDVQYQKHVRERIKLYSLKDKIKLN